MATPSTSFTDQLLAKAETDLNILTGDQVSAKKALIEALDLQKQINKEVKTHNNYLLEMVGYRKDITQSIKHLFARTSELNKLSKQAERDMLVEVNKLNITKDGVARREISATIASMDQRNKSYLSELDHLNKIKMSGLLPILFILGKAAELYHTMDTAAAKFRMTTGFTRDNVKDIRSQAEKLAINLMHVGVTIDGAYESFLSIQRMMGSMVIASKELVLNTSLLKSQFGVIEDDSTGFLRNMAAVAGTSMEAQTNMAYVAQYMSQAAQVSFPLIMKDIAKMSGTTLSLISKFPDKIIKTAVELRRMGTELNKAAEGASKLLDFTTSIQDEMEASVLLGRGINLQQIRELTYRGRLAEANQKILDIATKTNFMDLDYFQRNSLAKALGKSVEEITNMVQVQEQWAAARRSSDKDTIAALKVYEKMTGMGKEQLKDEAEKVRLFAQTQANQATVLAIQAKFNQLIARVSSYFLPIIDKILGFILDNFDGIVRGTILVAGGFGLIYRIIGPVSNAILVAANSTKQLGDVIKYLGLGKFDTLVLYALRFSNVITKMFPLLGGLSKLFTFSKAIPVIGEIIMAIQGIYYTIKGVIQIYNDFFKDIKEHNIAFAILNGMNKLLALAPLLLWNVIVKPILDIVAMIVGFFNKDLGNSMKRGLESVDIFSIFTYPFRMAWNWITGLFGGKSPSQLGLSIVKGLVSVGAMIFDALTSPWRLGFAWIMDKIPGMSKFADKLRGGVSDIINTPVESRARAAYVSAVTVTPTGTTIAGTSTKDKPLTVTTQSNEPNSIDLLLAEIKGLRADLNSGKIKSGDIFLDGSKVSTYMDRGINFRGNFGTNV